MWGDPAKLTLMAYHLELGLRTEHHPVQILLGRLFILLPVGELAFRLNLMSAFFGALSVATIFFCVRQFGSVSSGTISALSLMVSHLHWWHASLNETYSFLAFSVGLLLFFCVKAKRGFTKVTAFCVGLFFALSFWNNFLVSSMLFPLIWGLAVLWRGNRKWFWGLAGFVIGQVAVFFIVGAVSGWEVVKHDLSQMVTSKAFLHYIQAFPFLKGFVFFVGFTIYQFPSAALFLAYKGFLALGQKQKALQVGLSLTILSIVLFASSYMFQRRFNLYLPIFVLIAFFVGYGFEALRESKKRKAFLLSIIPPIIVYHLVTLLPSGLIKNYVGIRTIPYRDTVRYFLVPYKTKEWGPKEYFNETAMTIPKEGILYADFTPAKVLVYYRTVPRRGRHFELRGVDYPFTKLKIAEVKRALAKGRKVFIASDELTMDYNLAELRLSYELIPQGPIFALRPKGNVP